MLDWFQPPSILAFHYTFLPLWPSPPVDWQLPAPFKCSSSTSFLDPAVNHGSHFRFLTFR
jgi:hypothetical protein